MRHFLPLIALVIIAAAAMGLVPAPTPAPVAETRGALDPTQAFANGQNERWMVWRTQDMLGDRQRSERRTIRTQLFRQRPGSPVAELIFEDYNQNVAQAVGVFIDGSVLVSAQDRLVLIDRHGESRTLEINLPGHRNAKPMLNAAFEEGLFVQPVPQRGGVRTAPLYFVPFRDGELAGDAAVELTKGDGVRPRVRRPMARSGPEIAWFDEQGLHILDIHTLEVRDAPIKGGRRNAYDEVRAFDGRFVAMRTEVIDLETNKKTLTLNSQAYPLTIRDGVLYELTVQRANPQPSSLVISARPANGDRVKRAEIYRCGAYNVYTGYSTPRPPSVNSAWPAVHVGDDGLRLFDGESWVLVPYTQTDTPDANKQ